MKIFNRLFEAIQDPYYRLVLFNALISFGSLYLFKVHLVEHEFVNYTFAVVYFGYFLIFNELGGYTKVQFRISEVSIASDRLLFLRNVWAYQFLLLLICIVVIYFINSGALGFFFYNIIAYQNLLWFASASKTEEVYLKYHYVIKGVQTASVGLIIFNLTDVLLITSLASILVYAILIFYLLKLYNLHQIRQAIWQLRPANLLYFFRVNKEIAIAGNLNSFLQRYIETYFVYNLTGSSITRFGYLKGLIDKISSFTIQYLVNRNMVIDKKGLENANLSYYLKRLIPYLSLLLLVAVSPIMGMVQVERYDGLIIVGVVGVNLFSAIVIRFLIYMKKEAIMIWINSAAFGIFLIVKISITTPLPELIDFFYFYLIITGMQIAMTFVAYLIINHKEQLKRLI